MCGRYALKILVPELARMLDAETGVDFSPRYNIAPTQHVPICRLTGTGSRRIDVLRWGLIPSWARDEKIGQRLINARAETVADKPSFRAAFRRRRCLVPADGYFEWKRTGSRKQPYFIHSVDGAPLCFAALWERWERPGDAALDSFTIITTAANQTAGQVHHRMPVIIPPAAHARWLDSTVDDPTALSDLLRPCPQSAIAVYPVSTYVNNARHEGERCITPLTGLSR